MNTINRMLCAIELQIIEEDYNSTCGLGLPEDGPRRSDSEASVDIRSLGLSNDDRSKAIFDTVTARNL